MYINSKKTHTVFGWIMGINFDVVIESDDYSVEVAQQVVDMGRSARDVAQSLELGNSTVDKWARQLRNERNGQVSTATPLTPDQLKIRELERKNKQLESDNTILKKASALLILDSLKGFR